MKTQAKKLLIGGAALVELGSSRHTEDTDYLVNDPTRDSPFFKDVAANIDYCNAAGHKFFAEVWKLEMANIGPIASPQTLLELKAFAFVQHCLNRNWRKADDCEYDIKFLVSQHSVRCCKIVQKHVTPGQFSEIQRVIDSVLFR